MNLLCFLAGSRPSVTDKILRRTSYAGERTELQGASRDTYFSGTGFVIYSAFSFTAIQDIRSKAATSEPRLYRKNTILTRHRAVKQTMRSHHSKQSGTVSSANIFFLAVSMHSFRLRKTLNTYASM